MTTVPAVLLAKLRRAGGRLPYLLRALGLVWAASRGWTVAWLALLAVQGLLPAASVLLTRALVNGLAAAVGTGLSWTSARPILTPAALLAGVILLGNLLSSLVSWVKTIQAELVQDHIRDLIHAKSVTVDLAFYDSAEYFDRLHRARGEAGYRPLALLENLGSLGQTTITLAAMAAILLAYGLWLPIVLLLSVVPGLYVLLHYRRRQRDVWRLTTTGERRAWYYDWLLTARETAAELRLFDLGGVFREAYQATRRRLRGERVRLIAAENRAKLGVSAFALLVAGAVMARMAWLALQGAATLGDLALFYQALNQSQGLLRSLLENLGNVYSNHLFLADLFEFLALEPQVVDPAQPVSPHPSSLTLHPPSFILHPSSFGPAIRFRNVTFAYPGGRGEAVNGLDLEIPAGQIAAIVGPNGAGKSTLVKLLCRFYDPAEGSITLDGVDLRELPLKALRQQITVLLQAPVQYSATVAENIALAFEAGVKDRAKIREAAGAAGADGVVERLPLQYDTVLGTWFEGGTDLSTGEWQRIALARAFYNRRPVVVLDEPTSAMDSWAEADWLARFRALVAGRTAIIITHRFTTAMRADVIHVMDGGRIVESGSHEELLGLGGFYAASWQAQMGHLGSRG